jgi:hypothetical protein
MYEQFSNLLNMAKNQSENSGFQGKKFWDVNSWYDNGYWATPTFDGQTFDQGSGLFTSGPLKSIRITKDRGQGKATNVFGGGASGQYENDPYLEFDSQGNFLKQENWSNMGTDKFTDMGALLVAAAATAGIGSAVAGAAGAAGAGGAGAAGGGAGAGAGTFGSFAGPGYTAGAGAGAAGSAAAGGGGLAGLFGGGGGASTLGTLGKLGSALAPLFSGGGSGGGGTGGTGGAGGGGLNLGGLGLQDIIGLIGGGVDANRQGDAAEKMLAWLNGNQAKMENLYSPDSPESKYLWDAMSRKDAAAGRNSQYGPRTADFAAKVAEAKANNIKQFTTGTSRAYADALNQDASKYAGLSAALQRAATGGGGGIDLGSIIANLGSSLGGLNLGGGINMSPDGVFGPSGSNWSGGTMSNDEIWEMINGGSVDVNGGSVFDDWFL